MQDIINELHQLQQQVQQLSMDVQNIQNRLQFVTNQVQSRHFQMSQVQPPHYGQQPSPPKPSYGSQYVAPTPTTTYGGAYVSSTADSFRGRSSQMDPLSSLSGAQMAGTQSSSIQSTDYGSNAAHNSVSGTSVNTASSVKAGAGYSNAVQGAQSSHGQISQSRMSHDIQQDGSVNRQALQSVMAADQLSKEQTPGRQSEFTSYGRTM